VKSGARLAIYHPPGRIGLKANPFGKDVANLQLYRALATHGGFSRVDLLSNLPVADADVAADLFPDGRPPCQVAGGSVLSTEAAAEGGVLFRGAAGHAPDDRQCADGAGPALGRGHLHLAFGA